MSFRSKPRSRLPYDGDPDTTAPRSLDRRSRNRDFANQVFGLPDHETWYPIDHSVFVRDESTTHESLARDDSRGKNYFRQLRGFAEKVSNLIFASTKLALTSRGLADKNSNNLIFLLGCAGFSAPKKPWCPRPKRHSIYTTGEPEKQFCNFLQGIYLGI